MNSIESIKDFTITDRWEGPSGMLLRTMPQDHQTRNNQRSSSGHDHTVILDSTTESRITGSQPHEGAGHTTSFLNTQLCLCDSWPWRCSWWPLLVLVSLSVCFHHGSGVACMTQNAARNGEGTTDCGLWGSEREWLLNEKRCPGVTRS